MGVHGQNRINSGLAAVPFRVLPHTMSATILEAEAVDRRGEKRRK